MDSAGKLVTLYSAQRQAVADILQRGETYYVKKKYIKQKYVEVSAVFLSAYEWYARQAGEVVPKPEQAESGVWAFIDAVNAQPGQGDKLLVLEVPETEIVFFDMLEWNRILNGQPLGDEKTRRHYEEQLQMQGIKSEYEVLSTAFYPLLKRELMDSWKALFRHDGPIKEGKEHGVAHVQAGLWLIRPEWIKEIL
ncbi:DUF3841 domain-containing protein [Ruminococcaceae bacterium OttesenSCG-928-I18]|nr:DUF3841 domain-containing protein [Ruminococcaceae bacterium OttesenSCG-928-I18]